MPSIRIVVKIPEGVYPDLIADLANVQLRDRAERLRVLAILGLRDLQQLKSARTTRDEAESSGLGTNTNDQKGATSKLIQRLTDSL